MSSAQTPTDGSFVWRDLTVDDADRVRDFYSAVTGWRVAPVSMGDYNDYSMMDADGQVVAGVCHRRGVNAKLPPQWLVYVQVVDVAASVERCVQLGGGVLDGPRDMGGQNFAVIRDPVGAVMALVGR